MHWRTISLHICNNLKAGRLWRRHMLVHRFWCMRVVYGFQASFCRWFCGAFDYASPVFVIILHAFSPKAVFAICCLLLASAVVPSKALVSGYHGAPSALASGCTVFCVTLRLHRSALLCVGGVAPSACGTLIVRCADCATTSRARRAACCGWCAKHVLRLHRVFPNDVTYARGVTPHLPFCTPSAVSFCRS